MTRSRRRIERLDSAGRMGGKDRLASETKTNQVLKENREIELRRMEEKTDSCQKQRLNNQVLRGE